MSEQTYDLLTDPLLNGHGGARPNAGRKPSGYKKSAEVIAFEIGRARNEAAKADLNELKFRLESKQYVDRSAVQQASATLFANFAQTMRSIRDNLERKGVPLAVCEEVDQVIEDALNSAASDLELYADEETDG